MCENDGNRRLRRGSRIRVHTPFDAWDKIYFEKRLNPLTGRMESIPLGYLRYPKPSEVNRRRHLLKARKVAENPEAYARELEAKKKMREARLKKLAAKRCREEGKGTFHSCLLSSFP